MKDYTEQIRKNQEEHQRLVGECETLLRNLQSNERETHSLKEQQQAARASNLWESI
jgi:hypothetical protein